MILATFHTLDGQEIIVTGEDLTACGRCELRRQREGKNEPCHHCRPKLGSILDGIDITDMDLTEAGRQLLKEKKDFREFHTLKGEKVLIRAKDGEKVLIKEQRPKFKGFYQSARVAGSERKKVVVNEKMIKKAVNKIVSNKIDEWRKKIKEAHND